MVHNIWMLKHLKINIKVKTYKSKNWSFQKGKQIVPKTRFLSHNVQDCCKVIDDWEVTLFEKCEMHEQLKEREMFWQHELETFYPLDLNGKEEYLF